MYHNVGVGVVWSRPATPHPRLLPFSLGTLVNWTQLYTFPGLERHLQEEEEEEEEEAEEEEEGEEEEDEEGEDEEGEGRNMKRRYRSRSIRNGEKMFRNMHLPIGASNEGKISTADTAGIKPQFPVSANLSIRGESRHTTHRACDTCVELYDIYTVCLSVFH